MAYGDTMTYVYKVEVENENGEAETQNETLHLTYNANTYFIYKRFFNGNLMNDILKMTSSNKPLSKEFSEKIASGELTLDNLDKVDDIVDKSEFGNMEFDDVTIIQIIVAMIATYEQLTGVKRSVEEIASGLQGQLLTNVEFMTEFMQFLLFGVKKKKGINRH